MNVSDLQKDLNASLKAGQSVRVATLRLLLSAVRNSAIAKYGNAWETSVTDADITDVVKKQIKMHKESILAFGAAGRTELVQSEEGELHILEEFAPKEISDDELRVLLAPIAALKEPNFGLRMKQAMAVVHGQADGGRVSAMLRQLASSK